MSRDSGMLKLGFFGEVSNSYSIKVVVASVMLLYRDEFSGAIADWTSIVMMLERIGLL